MLPQTSEGSTPRQGMGSPSPPTALHRATQGCRLPLRSIKIWGSTGPHHPHHRRRGNVPLVRVPVSRPPFFVPTTSHCRSSWSRGLLRLMTSDVRWLLDGAPPHINAPGPPEARHTYALAVLHLADVGVPSEGGGSAADGAGHLLVVPAHAGAESDRAGAAVAHAALVRAPVR